MAIPAGAGGGTQQKPPPKVNPATGATGAATPVPGYDPNSLLSLLPGLVGDQSSQLQQDYGFQKQRLGLQGQGDAITRQALLRQLGLLGSEYGIQQQGFGLQGQSIQQAIGSAKYGSARQTEQFRGSEGAKGAVGTKGYGSGMADIRKALSDQLSTLGREQKRLGLSEKSAALSFKENKAEINDALAKLKLKAKERGITANELYAHLQNALTKTGLSQFLTVADILQQSGPLGGAQQGLGATTGLLDYMTNFGSTQLPDLAGSLAGSGG